MRKLIESTFVTLNGVISSPEQWGPPYWDEEHAAYGDRLSSEADAMLLGRATYEGFAQAWPNREGDGADWFNGVTKHVVTTTLTEAVWGPATLIKENVAEQVRALKQQDGKNIVKWGTGELDRTLLEHRLVDEYHFWIFPVIVGSGDHLFEGVDTTHLQLVDTTPFKSGIVVHTYAPKSPNDV